MHEHKNHLPGSLQIENSVFALVGASSCHGGVDLWYPAGQRVTMATTSQAANLNSRTSNVRGQSLET